MSNILLYCKNETCNKDQLCNVRYKINKCENKEIYHLYQLNWILKSKKHGILNNVKEYIDELIYEKDVSIKRYISNYLTKKYNILQSDLPSLQQIQNYVKYLKRQVFDNNKRSDVQNFIVNNGYHNNIGAKDYFTFGEKNGNGTDADHFQIGFTSINLMSRLPLSYTIFYFLENCIFFNTFIKLFFWV